MESLPSYGIDLSALTGSKLDSYAVKVYGVVRFNGVNPTFKITGIRYPGERMKVVIGDWRDE